MTDTAQLTGRKRPHVSGFRHRRIRDFQALPYGWGELTGVDVSHLKQAVRAILDENPCLPELEACLLLWSSLTTGRSYEDLLPLRLHVTRSLPDWAAVPPALVRDGGQWAWWLDAKDRAVQKPAKKGMRPVSGRIYLPATNLTADIIERCLTKRNVTPQKLSRSLFTIGGSAQVDKSHPLVVRMGELLERRDQSAVRPSRTAAATVESITRWLPATLNEAAGGDMALTAAITGEIPSIARTSSAYGAASQDNLARHYRAAIAQADTVTPVALPRELADTHIGGRFTPSDETVRALTSALAQDLETAPPRPVSELHDAMTRHSVGLLAFALAHRGTSGTLPAVQDIDEQTRFYWLDDKNVRGHTTKRMVWISDMTAKQLSLYDRHVRDLEKMLPEMAPDIRAIRQQPGLPLFSMKQGSDGPINEWGMASRSSAICKAKKKV